VIRQLKPAVVVLAASWQIYEAGHLHGTITVLKHSGMSCVVMLRPGLIWNYPPSRIVLRHW